MLKRIRHHWARKCGDGQNHPSAAHSAGRTAAILLGAPDDRGVLNVGGRLGAGHGPAATRQLLGQFMLGMAEGFERIELHEGFDVGHGDTIASSHAEMRRAVADAVERGLVPIVIGGGHDYGYPHAAGASDALGRGIALINVDAHLDVRPLAAAGITSGSPFYLALEEGVVRPDRFVEFGIQEHCNDRSFRDYVVSKGARVVMLDETRRSGDPTKTFCRLLDDLAKKAGQVVVSFDVDAVQMAHAPGVSAPQADGFTPADFLAMARHCGTHPAVVSIGFFEYAPPLDEQQKTGRLVATAIHRFLSGLSERGVSRRRDRNPVRRLARALRQP